MKVLEKIVAKLKVIVHKYHLYIALVILAVMFALSLFTMKNDSAIVDEVAHIPAGYSYLKYGDYRLNPEHPPLIKDISAAPLLLLKLKFPENIPAWAVDANGQWEVGWNFIYHIGNDATQILFYSRLPILVLGLILGFGIYWFCLKRFGPTVALLALTFYALSPNVLAHDHFVTTDLGIAAFTFFSIWTFLNWIENPTSKTNVLLAALFFALAQLTKFSAIMLVPFFVGLVALKLLVQLKSKDFWKKFRQYLFGGIIIFVVGFLLVWLFYIPHTINMPAQTQDKLIQESLPSGYYNMYGKYLTSLNDNALIKPMVQYALGLLMVVNRVRSGNITYFLGDATNQSFFWYFPVSFVLKTPLPMLLLILGVIVFGAVSYFRHRPFHIWSNFKDYTQKHFVELTCILFIIFYSYLSITGNLNLGIRHLFPMMPFVFILVAKKSIDLYHKPKKPAAKLSIALLLIVLTIWYVAVAFIQFPKYVPYLNYAFGGSGNASKYLSDSNVDWGQDGVRLAEYIKNNPGIDKIAVDYFGGADMRFYLCDRKYDPSGNLVADVDGYDCSKSKYLEWHVDYGKPNTKYIAVSETYLVSDIFYQKYKPRDYNYQWLRDKTPVVKIGDSIYIYEVN